MNTGEWLIFFIIASIFIFAAWDVWAKLSGKRTASREVIDKSYKSKIIAWLAFGFEIGLILVGVWLVLHWESLCILFGIACEISKNI